MEMQREREVIVIWRNKRWGNKRGTEIGTADEVRDDTTQASLQDSLLIEDLFSRLKLMTSIIVRDT